MNEGNEQQMDTAWEKAQQGMLGDTLTCWKQQTAEVYTGSK